MQLIFIQMLIYVFHIQYTVQPTLVVTCFCIKQLTFPQGTVNQEIITSGTFRDIKLF